MANEDIVQQVVEDLSKQFDINGKFAEVLAERIAKKIAVAKPATAIPQKPKEEGQAKPEPKRALQPNIAPIPILGKEVEANIAKMSNDIAELKTIISKQKQLTGSDVAKDINFENFFKKFPRFVDQFKTLSQTFDAKNFVRGADTNKSWFDDIKKTFKEFKFPKLVTVPEKPKAPTEPEKETAPKSFLEKQTPKDQSVLFDGFTEEGLRQLKADLPDIIKAGTKDLLENIIDSSKAKSDKISAGGPPGKLGFLDQLLYSALISPLAAAGRALARFAGFGGKAAAAASEAGKVATGASEAGKVATGASEAGKVATGASEAGKVATGASEAGKVATGASEAGKVATGASEAGKVATGVSEAGKVATGASEAGKVAVAAGTVGKFAAGARLVGKVAAPLAVVGMGVEAYEMYKDPEKIQKTLDEQSQKSWYKRMAGGLLNPLTTITATGKGAYDAISTAAATSKTIADTQQLEANVNKKLLSLGFNNQKEFNEFFKQHKDYIKAHGGLLKAGGKETIERLDVPPSINVKTSDYKKDNPVVEPTKNEIPSVVPEDKTPKINLQEETPKDNSEVHLSTLVKNSDTANQTMANLVVGFNTLAKALEKLGISVVENGGSTTVINNGNNNTGSTKASSAADYARNGNSSISSFRNFIEQSRQTPA